MTTGLDGADEMEDYAAFCRNRLRTCFHRRRKYPVGSDGWTLAVTEARMFLRSYREELQCREINRIAQVLEINAPAKATAEERRQWIAWWKSSCTMAETVTDEYKAYLKNGGWWPPLSANMVAAAPLIVLRTSRPGLYADEGQPTDN
jgi:hypothetical protein